MIQAIETKYKGYRFRSRLEARWAVFFDAIGIPWEYEPEGFETSVGGYLPDFRLFGTLFAEVKPPSMKDAEFAKIKAFVSDTEKPLLVLVDVPGAHWYPVLEVVRVGDLRDPDAPMLPLVYAEWMDFGYSADKGRPWMDYRGQERPAANDLNLTDKFVRATEAARSARFEHGENGT